jgi:hypothetical protein
MLVSSRSAPLVFHTCAAIACRVSGRPTFRMKSSSNAHSLEQRALALRECHALLAKQQLARRRFQQQVAYANTRQCPTRTTAPQERTDARQQLRRVERLGEIVVRTGVEATHAIRDGVSRREHQHRCLHPSTAKLGRDIEPVPPRQPDVDDREIRLLLQRLQETALTIAGGPYEPSLFAKNLLEQCEQVWAVFDDENSRGVYGRGHRRRR